jgi:SAM-dependent methyltransferase
MPAPDHYSFQRYLQAKRSVEDRALNRLVWDSLAGWLRLASSETLNIVDAGGGTGSMLIRLLEADLLRRANYTILDQQDENLEFARRQIERWREGGAQWGESRPGQEIFLHSDKSHLQVNFVLTDIYTYFSAHSNRSRFDLLIAHAVLDLLDLSRALPLMLASLNPEGRFYFPINFDGLTIFEPVIDRPFEEEIYRFYHQSMDWRQHEGLPSGESETGRKLIHRIGLAGAQVRAAGGSDWIVFPQDGGYQDDEAYFLYHILYFIETSLDGHPELDQNRFKGWLEQRRGQIERGELVFLTHQVDLFGVR